MDGLEGTVADGPLVDGAPLLVEGPEGMAVDVVDAVVEVGRGVIEGRLVIGASSVGLAGGNEPLGRDL